MLIYSVIVGCEGSAGLGGLTILFCVVMGVGLEWSQSLMLAVFRMAAADRKDIWSAGLHTQLFLKLLRL